MFSVEENTDALYIVKDGKLTTFPLTGDVNCFVKAKLRNQPTFTLVGQDVCAVETINLWKDIVSESSSGKSPKIAMADDDIAIFTEFADTHPDVMKVPD